MLYNSFTVEIRNTKGERQGIVELDTPLPRLIQMHLQPLEPTYGELHGYLYKSDEQKQAEAQWQDGFNAYLKFQNYDFNASPEWQEGYQQSWREINCINVNLDPNGTYTDIAWQGFLELGGKA